MFQGTSNSPLSESVIPLNFSAQQHTVLPLRKKVTGLRGMSGWLNSDNFADQTFVFRMHYGLPVTKKVNKLYGYEWWSKTRAENVLTGSRVNSSMGQLGVNLRPSLSGTTILSAVMGSTLPASPPNTLPISFTLALTGRSFLASVGNVLYQDPLNIILPLNNPPRIQSAVGQLTVVPVVSTIQLSGQWIRLRIGQLVVNQQTPPSGGNRCVCAICGKRVKCNELKKRWDGILVCREDWEPRHPQEFMQPSQKAPNENEGNPESLDIFINPGSVKPSDL